VKLMPTHRAALERQMKLTRQYGREEHWRRMDAMAGEAEDEFHALWHPRHAQWQHRPQFSRAPTQLVSDLDLVTTSDTAWSDD